MKKLSVLLFAAITALLSISCEGPMGRPGLDGKDGEDGYSTTWSIHKFTIQPNEWLVGGGQAGDLNTFFYVDKTLGALNYDIFSDRGVLAYIETDNGVKNGMPFVLHLGENQDGEDYYYTRTIDFSFEEGRVSFYLTYSDFFTQYRPDKPFIFHVVLMY